MKKIINTRLKVTSMLVLGVLTTINATSLLAAKDLHKVGQYTKQHIEASQLLEKVDFMPMADHLTAYKHKGITIENKAGKTLSVIRGDFGSIDHRIVKNGLLVATVDKQKQQAVITLFNKHSQNWTDTRRLPKTDFKIEGVCLYQDLADNSFMFLLGEEGHGQQWLVADSSTTLNTPKLIRNLSTPPNSEFCQVDDKRALLFVNEENVGIWAYDASPEADLIRKPVALTHPFGEIKATALGMQLVPNGLLIIDEAAKDLLVYGDNNNTWKLKSIYTLTTLDSPKNLSVRINKDQLDIAIQDDQGLVFYTLPWSEKTSSLKTVLPTITPEIETDPVASLGDAADDPAIWVNKYNPAESRVLATDKQGGLVVYDMAGKTKQRLPVGRINNVDIRTGFSFKGHNIDLAVASNRDNNTLEVFAIAPKTGQVTSLGQLPTKFDDIYGLCMYKDNQGAIYTIANDKNGHFVQYRMNNHQGQLSADVVREFNVDTQPEGCVADDVNNRLFIGEEDVALWTLDARPNAATTMQKVISVGKNIKADIEGVSVYQGEKASYVVISSQGNDSYAVVDALPPFTYRGSFKVGINSHLAIDGTSETDGLDVTSTNLGGEFKQGMLVVQDGRNRMPEQNQNFKYIPWSRIADQLNLIKH